MINFLKKIFKIKTYTSVHWTDVEETGDPSEPYRYSHKTLTKEEIDNIPKVISVTISELNK